MKKILLIVGLTAGTVLSALAGNIDIYDSKGYAGWAERNGDQYDIYSSRGGGYQGWMQRNGDQYDVYSSRGGGYQGYVDQNGYFYPNHR